jgi:LemA protein
MITLYIVLGIILLLIILIWATYNSLVRLNIKTDEALSDITVQMKRRYDLVPNLIDSVKGYAKHEKSTLSEVTKARTSAMKLGEGDIHSKAEADNMMTSTLKSLFAVAESYPELKANENFMKLQEELSDTEDKIQASRRFYNSNVTNFNTKLKVFPTNIFGNMLGFKPKEFFEVNDSEKAEIEKAPKTNF